MLIERYSELGISFVLPSDHRNMWMHGYALGNWKEVVQMELRKSDQPIVLRVRESRSHGEGAGIIM